MPTNKNNSEIMKSFQSKSEKNEGHYRGYDQKDLTKNGEAISASEAPDVQDVEITFDLLMSKYNFHHEVCLLHANLAQRVGEMILTDFKKEAQESERFEQSFFE